MLGYTERSQSAPKESLALTNKLYQCFDAALAESRAIAKRSEGIAI